MFYLSSNQEGAFHKNCTSVASSQLDHGAVDICFGIWLNDCRCYVFEWLFSTENFHFMENSMQNQRLVIWNTTYDSPTNVFLIYRICNEFRFR